MNKLLLTLVSVAHLAPHPFGVSPVGAMSIYAGAYGRRSTFWLLPALPLLVGHLLWGFYEPLVMAFVYGGFMLSSISGYLFLRGNKTTGHYAAAVVCASLVFYLVSNFSIWLAGYYPPTAAGLAACYINGLPYLGVSVLANAGYSFVLFGLHHVMMPPRYEPAAA